jgi:hypothetical protein|tara:strand:+ start:188 stop:472 length:285 start_codon:yes stop_codon:yes gene_type:complete
MSMKPIKPVPWLDAVVATGKYTDNQGNEKTRYVNIGTVFKRDDGSVCMKLDAVPVGVPDWQGWVNFFDKKPRNERRPDTVAKTGGDDLDDEIPF